MTRRDKERVSTLERRRDFLAKRVSNYRADGNDSRDRAELYALNWALRIVEEAERTGVLNDFYNEGLIVR